MTKGYILPIVVLAALLQTISAQQDMRRLVDLRVQVRLLNSSLQPRGILLRLQAEQMPGGQSIINTDSSGKAVFTNLPQAIYSVTAEFPGFTSQAQTVDLQNTNGSYIVFELKPKVDEKNVPAVPPEGPFATLAANIDPEAQKKFHEGEKQLQKRNPDSAISNFKKAVEIAPDFTEAYLALGTTYMDTGEFLQAQEVLAKVVAKEPKLPAAHFALGASYNRTKNFPQAEQQLRAGLALNDKVADGHYELARVLLSTGRLQEGEQHVRKALELDNTHARSHLLLGNVLLAKKDLQGAINSYREYLKLDPNGPMADATKQMIEKLEKQLKKGS